MPSVKLLDGVGIRTPVRGWVFPFSGGKYALKREWLRRVKQVTPQPPAGSEELEWVLVREYVPPDIAVSNVTISGPGAVSIGPTQQGNVTVNWSVVAEGWASTLTVRLRWFVNGAFYDSTSVAQSAGAGVHAFYGGTNVYAEVSYENSAGTGPVTTTSSVHVGA